MSADALRDLREELREHCVAEQNHIALALFAENDALRAVIADLMAERNEG